MCANIDFHKLDLIAKAKSQQTLLLETVGADLRSSANIEILNGFIFKSSTKSETFKISVLLNFELCDEIFCEFVTCTKTENDRQWFLIDGLLERESCRIENVCSKCQFVSDL